MIRLGLVPNCRNFCLILKQKDERRKKGGAHRMNESKLFDPSFLTLPISHLVSKMMTFWTVTKCKTIPKNHFEILSGHQNLRKKAIRKWYWTSTRPVRRQSSKQSNGCSSCIDKSLTSWSGTKQSLISLSLLEERKYRLSASE